MWTGTITLENFISTKYKNVIFSYPAVWWLSFVFSLELSLLFSLLEFCLWSLNSLPFFHKNEMQNKAWLEVKSKFLYLSASNYDRLFEAKAHLAVGWLHVLGKGPELSLRMLSFDALLQRRTSSLCVLSICLAEYWKPKI